MEGSESPSGQCQVHNTRRAQEGLFRLRAAGCPGTVCHPIRGQHSAGWRPGRTWGVESILGQEAQLWREAAGVCLLWALDRDGHHLELVSLWWGGPGVAPSWQPGSPQPPGLQPRCTHEDYPPHPEALGQKPAPGLSQERARPAPVAQGQPPLSRSWAGGTPGVPHSLSLPDLRHPLTQPATSRAQRGPTGLGPRVARATVLCQRLTVA